jgi:hypothetical protein
MIIDQSILSLLKRMVICSKKIKIAAKKPVPDELAHGRSEISLLTQ